MAYFFLLTLHVCVYVSVCVSGGGWSGLGGALSPEL